MKASELMDNLDVEVDTSSTDQVVIQLIAQALGLLGAAKKLLDQRIQMPQASEPEDFCQHIRKIETMGEGGHWFCPKCGATDVDPG